MYFGKKKIHCFTLAYQNQNLLSEGGGQIGGEYALLQIDAPICTTSCFLVVPGQVLKLFFWGANDIPREEYSLLQ
jgi:hypothetical protein